MKLVTMAIAKRMRNPKGDPTAGLTYPPGYEAAQAQIIQFADEKAQMCLGDIMRFVETNQCRRSE